MTGNVLAVHVARGRVRVAIVDDGGGLLQRRMTRGPLPDDWRAVLRAATRPFARHCTAAVVAVAGRVDYRAAAVERSNIPSAWAAELAEPALQDVLGLPVALAKDADVAAVGEAWFGSARGWADVLYVALVPDAGVGVLLDGRVVHGRRSVMGPLFAAGDTEASRPDVDRAERLITRSRSGDIVARGAWEELVEVVRFEVTRLAHVFVPECIVVEGGPGLTGRLLVEPLRTELRRHGPDVPTPIHVVRAALGDASVLAGAAAWRQAFPAAGTAQLVGAGLP